MAQINFNQYEFAMEETPVRCRIRAGYEGAGRLGYYFGRIFVRQYWGIVLWDGDEDPDTFKTAGLELQSQRWIPQG